MTAEVLPGGAPWGDRFVAYLGSPRSPGWIGAGELFGPALATVLDAVGRARGTTAPDVAGTLLFEQYALRLVAPVLAALYGDGDVLDASLPLVSAQVVDGSLRRLAFGRPRRAGGVTASSEVLARLVAGNLDPTAEAVHEQTRIGTRVLRGAMANAAVSALLHMSWRRPDPAHHVADALELVAAVPGWDGLVNVRAVEVRGRRWMYTDRNTCCQAFRTTVNQTREQRYCLTCPFTPRATTGDVFAEATADYLARTRSSVPTASER